VKVLSAFRRIPYSLRVAILIVILAKILVFSLGYAATYMHEGPAPPLTIVMKEFNKWDAPHYIDLAKNWYVNTGDPANFIVFFPLYPVLIRLATVDFSYISLSALAVSNVCSIIAFIYLFKLAKLDFDDGVAKKAVLFLSVFPTAYFLSAPYTEGLFFALAIASLYYARLGKWPLAGFLGFFAALTRIAGLLLLPTLLVECLHQRGWKWRKTNASILWIGLALLGFLIYLNINNQVTGNPFTFMTVEREHWFNRIDPVEGMKQALYAAGKSFPENITLGITPLVFTVFGALPVIWGFLHRLRPSYTVYMLFTWLLAVSTSFWISVPRYVMSMFPMFIIFGLLTRKRAVGIAVTVVFLAALCFFTVLFALGGWAF
jgi:hypothetical protein